MKRKVNEPISIFYKLNSYHLNKKIITEKKPETFLDAGTVKRGCAIETKVYNNSKKLTVVFGLQKFLPNINIMP